MKLLSDTFKDKTVLITGHTGFKGSWLSIWLNSLGAKVIGCSSDIPSEPSNFIASKLENFIEDIRLDIRDVDSLKDTIRHAKPDFVFHLAAQSLVRSSYANPLDTLGINAIGSANVLESLRELEKESVAIMITSDKAYDNVEWSWGYRETDKLGGKDPYSASKGMAELAIRSYIESFFQNEKNNVRIGIARAGNVIGGGDWAKDRIIPDCIKAWSEEKTVDIRNPHATRPWQHVLEPLSGYLLLACNLSSSEKNHGEPYNFGPSSKSNYSVGQLIDEIKESWDKANWNDVSEEEALLYEAGLLKLNCDKALFDLDWQPTLNFKETVKMTADWYKHYFQGNESSMYDFSISQIEDYVRIAQSKSISWSKDD